MQKEYCIGSVKELMQMPEYVPYFKGNRVYVGGTLFIEENKVLLVRQYVGTPEQRYPVYKIPGGVMKKSVVVGERPYYDQLRITLRSKGYPYPQIELIIAREKCLFRKRTSPERSFILKFLSETGLMPLTFHFVFFKTHYSNRKGEENDPKKSFLHIYFIVTDVADAVTDNLPINDINCVTTIRDRAFPLDPDIIDPRVYADCDNAVKMVINRHEEAMKKLCGMQK